MKKLSVFLGKSVERYPWLMIMCFLVVCATIGSVCIFVVLEFLSLLGTKGFISYEHLSTCIYASIVAGVLCTAFICHVEYEEQQYADEEQEIDYEITDLETFKFKAAMWATSAVAGNLLLQMYNRDTPAENKLPEAKTNYADEGFKLRLHKMATSAWAGDYLVNSFKEEQKEK